MPFIFEFVRLWQIIELNDFCVLFAVPSTPKLCYDQGRRSGYESGGGTDWCVTHPFPAGGLGVVSPPPAGSGAEPRRQTHFGENLWQINLKSGIFSVAVYTPISDPISVVQWLVRRKIGSAVRGCAKLVDIRMLNIENDGLMTSPEPWITSLRCSECGH